MRAASASAARQSRRCSATCANCTFTWNPRKAICSAGLTSWARGFFPKRLASSAYPFTAEGTATLSGPALAKSCRAWPSCTYMSGRAASGPTSRKSSTCTWRSRAVQTRAKPPPPSPELTGPTTLRAKAAGTAAATAFPPCRSIEAPAPYFQMRRLATYERHAEFLIAQGKAYGGDCTKEELDRLREQAAREKRGFKYPGICRDKKLPRGTPGAVVRFRMPDEGATTFKDLVKGEITTQHKELHDEVILRSDGVPLYNFGAVVDDVEMEITLVARGDDRVVNTT